MVLNSQAHNQPHKSQVTDSKSRQEVQASKITGMSLYVDIPGWDTRSSKGRAGPPLIDRGLHPQINWVRRTARLGDRLMRLALRVQLVLTLNKELERPENGTYQFRPAKMKDHPHRGHPAATHDWVESSLFRTNKTWTVSTRHGQVGPLCLMRAPGLQVGGPIARIFHTRMGRNDTLAVTQSGEVAVRTRTRNSVALTKRVGEGGSKATIGGR